MRASTIGVADLGVFAADDLGVFAADEPPF